MTGVSSGISASQDAETPNLRNVREYRRMAVPDPVKFSVVIWSGLVNKDYNLKITAL
jgi:hypothetical protein